MNCRTFSPNPKSYTNHQMYYAARVQAMHWKPCTNHYSVFFALLWRDLSMGVILGC